MVIIVKIFSEFINQYGLTFIHSLAVGIISYVSLEIKRIYKKYATDHTKKEVIEMVCKAIKQLYPDKKGSEKLDLAVTNAKEILDEKGINISDLELRMYIESTICCFKQK